MTDFCADLRAAGYDDLAELWDAGFDKFTYVRELQRAFQLTLHRVAEIDALHRPYGPNECLTCEPGDGWPCQTREALDGQPIIHADKKVTV